MDGADDRGAARGRDEVLIRRYPNRRLYDTRASRYVGLEEVVAAIHAGASVRAEDSRSGQDITRELLLQALALDGERPDRALLSPQLLHALIRAGARVNSAATARALAWMLERVAEAFAPRVERVERRAEPEGGSARTNGSSPAEAPRALEDRVAALEEAVRKLAAEATRER